MTRAVKRWDAGESYSAATTMVTSVSDCVRVLKMGLYERLDDLGNDRSSNVTAVLLKTIPAIPHNSFIRRHVNEVGPLRLVRL